MLAPFIDVEQKIQATFVGLTRGGKTVLLASPVAVTLVSGDATASQGDDSSTWDFTASDVPGTSEFQAVCGDLPLLQITLTVSEAAPAALTVLWADPELKAPAVDTPVDVG